MTPRRALLIAPTYDGAMVDPLPGASELLDGLEAVLAQAGGYEVKRLTGALDERDMRSNLNALFDTIGEVFVYFYGHGVVRQPGVTVLCRSQAISDDEGLPLSELLQLANKSEAREVVAVIDCCHSGNPLAPSHELLQGESALQLWRPGTALLASCMAAQQSHIEEGESISSFSKLVLEGLEGAGRLPNSDTVSASSLFWFVSDQIARWGQDPVELAHQTGQRRCNIVRHPSPQDAPSNKDVGGKRRLGLPFTPSVSFVGREAEIEFLRAFLCGTDRPLSLSATVEGLGGIGKTELVLQLLHDPEVDAAFPSILWFDASAPLEPQWAYFAGQIGTPSVGNDSTDAGAALVESLRKNGRVLVILDNATTWSEIKHHVPSDVSVIATTRSRAFGDSSFVRQELGTLSSEAAERFLATMLPDADTSTLTRIADRLGGHALALEIAGHYIHDQCSPEEYLERLEVLDAKESTASAAHRTHYGKTLAQCLQISWDGLRSDAARDLWLRAALFAPASAHRDLLRAIAVRESALQFVDRWDFETEEGNLIESRTIPASAFQGAYQELRDVHVLARVEGHNGERWAMHRLVRDFARKRLSPADMTLHAAVLAEWLEKPSLPIEPEAPHIVSAILDIPRFGTVDAEVLGSRLHLRGWGYSRPIFGKALIRHLGRDAGHPQAISLIFEGIVDVNADVRIQAIRMMEELGPIPEIGEALGRILDDPSPEVRNRAAESIVEHGTWSSRTMLERAIATSSRATDSALKALGRQPSDEGRKLLEGACERLSGDSHLEAAIQLGLCGGGQAVSILLPALTQEADPNRYRRIRKALGAAGPDRDELFAALEKVAWGKHPEQALAAALELAREGDLRATQRILELAPDLRERSAWRSSELAGVIAAVDPGLLADATAFMDETEIVWTLQRLEEPKLEEAVARLRDRGAVTLAEKAEAQLQKIHEERAKEKEQRAKREEISQRLQRLQTGEAEALDEVGYELPSPDSWLEWAAAIEKAERLTKAGTPTESPRAAWRRVFATEMTKGTGLATAQQLAKAARNEAATRLMDEEEQQ